jgi:serine/threonine protein kinase/ABC-type branched-subunit amino acid transport system substrate-binding protein
VPLKPGDRIERYVIESLLGSGGMGEVYRAHDPRLKRSIALKILHAEPPADANSATSSPVSNPGARMLREAQLAAAFEHPNVVHVYDVGQLEEPPELRGTTYLAMELIRGEPLRKYIGDASVKMKTRVRWLEEIARALGAAHAAGLVHRDVKPENVVIRDDGVAKVLDFGVAKRTIAAPIDPTSSTEGYAVPTMTQQGVVVGTPFYMAPEQLRAETLDGRADQFAWGVVAYELLTGKPLWSLVGGGFSLVAQILQTPPPSVTAFADVTPRVAQTIVRALSKDPAMRFASMVALVEELTGKVEGHESEARLPLSRPSAKPSGPDFTEVATQAIAPVPKESGAPAAPPTNTKRSVRLPSIPAEGPITAEVSAKRVMRGFILATAAGVFALLLTFGAKALYRARSEPKTSAAGGILAAASLPDASTCTSNAECTKQEGTPAICRQRCVKIESPDCHASADSHALESSETIWIGELFPLTGPRAFEGTSNEKGAELGRLDFADVASGLGGRARPLALVSCDDAVDAPRAARHLVEDLGVRAILGFRSGATLVDLAGSLFAQNHVLAIDSMTVSPLVTRLPRTPGEPPLVWRTMFSLSDAAPAIAALLESQIEPELRKASVPRTRIALVRPKTSGALAFSERFFDVLRFNGQSAMNNGSQYRDFVFDTEDADGYARGLAHLEDFAPNVVVFVDEAIAKNVIAPFERAWPRSSPTRPRYIDALSFGDAVLEMARQDRSVRARMFGLTLPSTTSVNARFTMHYNETFGTELTRADAPSTSYDAFYLLAYASFALGDRPATGSNLARAIERLVPPGAPVDVGPSGIFDALTRLRAGDSIDVNGAGTTLDYDLSTGESPVDLSVLCVDVDREGRPTGNVESGAVFSATAGRIVGNPKCP